MADDLRVVVDADATPLVRELRRAGVEVRGFGGAVRGQTGSAAAFNAALDKQRQSLRGLATWGTRAGIAIGGGFALAVGHAIRTGAEFESQMARVQAVTQATGEEMDELRELAIRLGADTKFSAGESAEAMYELASAGFDVAQTSKALPGVLDLAAASGIELADAAEIGSNALRGFGLETEQSTHVADVLAESVNTSSVEMQDLQLALKYIGPVARATGQDLEEMIAAVSLMGDEGIKGEQAGTTLRAGLLRLVKPTTEVKDGLSALGLEAEDLQGPNGLLPLPQLVGTLRDGMEGLSRSERSAALAGIFGQEALAGMLTVVEAGPKKVAALTREFENSSGASKRAAETMNDTVTGALDSLTGSLETLEIQLYENFQEPLKEGLLEATDIVNTEGAHLQDALADAMSTPEFKRGDIGDKVDILVSTIGAELDRSDLPEEVGDALVDAFNWALPRAAEAAGHGAVTAAKAFANGFVESDSLGRLVIGAWLFSKLGGFAALRAAGVLAGAQVSSGMAAGIAGGAAASGAAGGAAAGAAGAGAAGGLLGKLKSIRWARIGGIGLGLALADVTLDEYKRRLDERSEDVVTALKGFEGSDDIVSKIRENTVGPYINSLFGRKDEIDAARDAAANLRAQFEQMLDKRVRLSDETIRGLRAQARQLDLTREARAELQRMFDVAEAGNRAGVKVDLGVDPEQLRQAEQGFDVLRRGWLSSLADIEKFGTRNEQLVRSLGLGSADTRKLVAENYRGMIQAIGHAMANGEISVKDGLARQKRLLRDARLITGEDPFGIAKGFEQSWKKAGGINKKALQGALKDLGEMPPAARQKAFETMVQFGRGLVQKKKIPEQDLRDFVSKALTTFDDLKTGGSQSSLDLAIAISGNFGSMGSAVGSVLEVIRDNANASLTKFGANPLRFAIKAIGALGSLGGQSKQQGGFIVGGSGSGDRPGFWGEAGAYVLNREATRAFGFNRGGSIVPLALEPGERYFSPPEVTAMGGARVLEGMNSAVPRQQGGPIGRPQIAGPAGPLRDIGQGAVDQVADAARAYLGKRRTRFGTGSAGSFSGGSGQYPGVSGDTDFLPALGQALSAMAKATGTSISVTSGWRSRAEQAALYQAYKEGKGNLAAPPGSSNHESGRAADISPGREVFGGAAGRFGLGFTVPSESWHIELLRLGGLVRQLAQGGWVKTGYTTYDIDGAGAFGNLMKGMGYAELGTASSTTGAATGTGYIARALGRSGELPAEFPLDVKIGSIGKVATLFKRDRGAGQGGDPYYSIDIHRLAWSALGLTGNNKGDAWIRPAGGDGGEPTEGEKKRAEAKKVKAHREAQINKFRKAVADAKTRPGKRGALWQLVEYWGEVGLFDKDSRKRMLEGVHKAAAQPNPLGAIPILANLAGYLRQNVDVSGRELGDKSLSDEIDRVRKQGTKIGDRRRKKRMKKIEGRGLDAKRRQILDGIEGDITALDERIDIRSREAGSEAGPGGSEYTDAETGDLVGLNQRLLGKLFRRRDMAKVIIGDLRERIAAVTKEIKAARPRNSKTHWKLKGLIENRSEARRLIDEMREGLIETQGLTGEGGRIFDTKMEISDLGFRSTDPGSDEREGERTRLQLEQTLQELTAERLKNVQLGDVREFLGEFGPQLPYLGAFMQGTGGRRVARDGIAVLHRDEMVTPDPKGPAGSQLSGGSAAPGPVTVNLYVDGDVAPLMGKVRAEIDGRVAKIDQTIGRRGRQLSVAPGR